MNWDLLSEWQELVGAIIGASTPLLFWFFTEWRRGYREHQEKLENMERTIVYNINSTLDTKKTLSKFLEEQLDPLIKGIENTPHQQYCAGTSYFPLFEFGFVDDRVMAGGSKSGYIDNCLLHLHRMSQDMRSSFNDTRRQFEQTVFSAKEMAIQKCNAPAFHNAEFKQNLIRFREKMIEGSLEGNIQIYLEALVRTHVALNELRKIGLFRWKLKYNKYKKEGPPRIEKLFEQEYQKEMSEILASEK